MDAIRLLEADHKVVKDLFEKYEAAGDGAYRTKQALFETIKSELPVHMDIEETIFYPTVKATPSEELKDDVREADEEHHVKEEEGEMFPLVKKRLDEARLEQLGEEMEERKEILRGEA